jgi:phosphatidylglycerol:prolipoprotein diacylglycerol transferase
MYPEIFHISFLHTYGVLVALAFLCGLWMAATLARRAGIDADAATNLGIYCALAAIAGAKLMMLIVDPRYRENPRDIFTLDTLQAGGIFYGGLLAALAVSWWYMRKTRLPLWRTADVFAPAIALGHGIGRLGCFSAGCCWGVECHLPWAVTFRSEAAHDLVGVPLGQPLHPTQIYEAAAEFAIFGVLYRRIARAHRPGAVIGLYLVLYSAARFLVEFFRNHEQGNLWGGPLDTSQWISLGLCAVGAWCLLRPAAMAPPPPQRPPRDSRRGPGTAKGPAPRTAGS